MSRKGSNPIRTIPATLAVAVLLLFLNAGCDPEEVVDTGNTETVVDSPADQANHTVCDPFANNPDHAGSSLDMGVAGNIQYLTDDMPRYTQVSDYLRQGVAVDATLFMDKIDIPTRKFDLGFVTQSGQLINNQDGNNLYEYFSLKLEAELRLGSSDPIGDYQFAVLSDDGANLWIDQGSGLEKVVDNDGTHPTRMGCATAPVNMGLTSSLPMKVEYYQGPRYHIALVVMWREWKHDGAFNPSDPLCGVSGNGTFFDYNTIPSTPTSNYNALLARGWKVLTSENYALPRSVEANPCTNAEPVRTFITATTPSAEVTNSTSINVTFNSNFTPATFECSLDGATPAACASPKSYSGLTNANHSVQVWATDSTGRKDDVGATYRWTVDTVAPSSSSITSTTTSTSITLTWTTTEPATSQVSWGTTSAVSNVIAEDPVYTTNHSVTITGLNANTRYFLKASGHDEAGNAYASPLSGAQTKP